MSEKERYVIGLDYSDPQYRPWEAFQQWKHHPNIKLLIEGGSIPSAGVLAIVTGGWQTLPKVEMPRARLIGETAGLLDNVPKIKATHQRIGWVCSRPNIWSNRSWPWMDSTPSFVASWLRGFEAMAALRRVRNIKSGFKEGLCLDMVHGSPGSCPF